MNPILRDMLITQFESDTMIPYNDPDYTQVMYRVRANHTRHVQPDSGFLVGKVVFVYSRDDDNITPAVRKQNDEFIIPDDTGGHGLETISSDGIRIIGVGRVTPLNDLMLAEDMTPGVFYSTMNDDIAISSGGELSYIHRQGGQVRRDGLHPLAKINGVYAPFIDHE